MSTATIPAWVGDLASFRRWAWSADFPQTGQYSFLGNAIWVDLSMEELWTHNQVKGAYAFALMAILDGTKVGHFAHDRMLWTNVVASVANEPDGLFFYWETMKLGRLREVQRSKDQAILEVEGTPDMVLEVVSKSSILKDTVRLRELYWKAKVAEYWLVDARGPQVSFDILVWKPDGFVEEQPSAGWLSSAIFGHQFQLAKGTNPLGRPEFKVLWQKS